MNYPKHLYEKIREEVAVEYLKHEFRKIFPSTNPNDIANLPNSRELSLPRDFWNGVHGVGMGFKLHIGLIYLLTAENVKWKSQKVKTLDLHFGVEREQLKKYFDHKVSAKELDEFYKSNPNKREEDKKCFDDSGREVDSIIVIEKLVEGEKRKVVYEGNGRVHKAVIEGKEELKAYVGSFVSADSKPINYWLPTSIIMDNLYFVYQAIKEKNEEVFESQIKALKYMLRDSEAGKYEFENRALTSREPERTKILEAFDVS